MIRLKHKTFRFCLVPLLLLGLTAVPEHAEAQFLKKLFGREEKRKPAKKNPSRQPETPSKPKRIKTIEYPPTKIKSKYRVDVLVPLYLEELVSGDKLTYKDHIPDKASSGISFYQGIQLAADSLMNLGYNLEVYVHDVTQPNLSPENLIKYKTLRGADLIIAAVSSNQLPPLADYAKKTNINLFSANSPSDAGISDNIFFTLLQPTLETHCEQLVKTIARKYADKNVFILHRSGNSVDSMAFDYISSAKEITYKKTVLIGDTLDVRKLTGYFDSTRSNVLVMPIVDIVYAEKMLAGLSLSFPGYKFEIFGMPSWRAMDIVRKNGTYENLGIYFTSPFYYDGTTKPAALLNARYKKEYTNRISEMVFRGYETLFWSAHLLQQYGTVFNNKLGDINFAPFTSFDIKTRWSPDSDLLYNENIHVYLYRYQAGSYTVEK